MERSGGVTLGLTLGQVDSRGSDEFLFCNVMLAHVGTLKAILNVLYINSHIIAGLLDDGS